MSAAQIEAVLEAMRYAPSAGNRRKWSFIVVTDRRKIRYLAGRVLRKFIIMRRLLASGWASLLTEPRFICYITQ